MKNQQVSDMLAKALTESGSYVVLERSDLAKVQAEAQLTGAKQNLVGVDALIVGSLSEFAARHSASPALSPKARNRLRSRRSTCAWSTSGPARDSLPPRARANRPRVLDHLRLRLAGRLRRHLNDASIRQAISEVVNRLAVGLQRRRGRPS